MSKENKPPVNLEQDAGNHFPGPDYRESINGYADEEINIRDYIDVVFRRKWLILGMLFFVFISALIFTLTQEKLYLAAGTLEVNPESQKVTKFEDVVSEGVHSKDFVSTQVAMLKSNALAERVVRKIDLASHPVIVGDGKEKKPGLLARMKNGLKGFVKSLIRSEEETRPSGPNPMQELISQKRVTGYFKGHLEITPSRDSLIVNVSFLSPDRQLSRDAVNHLMEEYVDWKMDQKVASSAKAREYLMKQIDRAKINLEAAEEKQHAFARQAGIVSMDSRLNSVFRQLEDINAALGQAEADLISKKAIYDQAVKDGPENLPQVLNSQLIGNLKEEYADLRSRYEELTASFHEEYPEVKLLKSRMDSIEARINDESGKIFNSIRHDYEAALSRVESLRENMGVKKDQALDLNQRATQYTIMAREVETNKAIYQSLLERAKEIESMAGVSPTNIQVVDKASLPIFPDKPDVRRNLMLAIVLGLMAGVGGAFAMEYFADTITNPDQISERFQIPILGVIPYENKSTEYPIERTFVSDPRAGISEALRTSKISIQLSGSESQARCFAVTSTFPQEGKTTMSVNLAQAFAGAGEKVLLIDGDLRKPRIHKVFPNAAAKNNGCGLSSYLAGVVNEHFIKKTSIENLYIIPSGPIPPNPVELLASNRFADLIGKLSDKFDRIIVDAPPHQGLADVLVLSRVVGGIILVSSIGETTRDGLRHFKKSMYNVNANVLGCIVNKLNLSKRYGYKAYYRYYRAYDYSYGTDGKRKPAEKALEATKVA